MSDASPGNSNSPLTRVRRCVQLYRYAPGWAAFELPPYPLTRALRLVQHALRHWDGRADSLIGCSMTETVRRGSLGEHGGESKWRIWYEDEHLFSKRILL